MKKTKLSSILLLSAAFLLAACNERTPTPAASSKTEPPASSSVVPAGTSSEDTTPVVSSSEDPTPVVSSSEDATPVVSSSQDTTPAVSSTPAASSDVQAEVVLTVEINGTVVNLAPEADHGTDVAVYKITLAVGDKLVIKGNGVALTIGEGSATEFTCKVAGEHIVYVNSGYVVWVNEPEVKVTYTITKNGTPLDLASVVPDGWTDKALFTVTCAAGDKIKVFADEVQVGEEYTCQVAGEYKFGINAKGELWVSAPAMPIVKQEIAVDLGTWAAEGEVVFAHSWKDGATYTDKVADGKVNVIEGCKGFLLVVMPEGSEDIDWNKKVKQTGDLTLGKGVLTYKEGNAFEWVEPAPAAKALTVEVNGTVVNQAAEADPGDNAAVYKITLEVGQKLVIKGDGVALPLGDTEATEFTCKVAGEHTVCVSKEYKVNVTEPKPATPEVVYTITKNGTSLDLASVVPAGSTDKAVFTATCAASDKIKVFADGEQVGNEYECPRDGEYTFGINADGEFWQTPPEAPAVVYSITSNGEPLNLVSVVPDGWTDKAVFTTTCKAGDKIKVFADSVQVGEEYTCKVDGEYTFGINAKGEFWQDSPLVKVEIEVDLGTWVEEGQVVFVYSWKGSTKLTEDLVNGKSKVIDECEGLLLVVMPAGSTGVVWEDEIKQTANITLHKGVLTYFAERDAFAWVSDDPEPEVAYTITSNGEPLNLVSVVPDGWTDKALFTTTCKAGDKIKVFADGTQVGAEYECPVDGEYKFGINAKGEFWQNAPLVKAEITVDLGTWAAEGQVVFAHSWKDGYANYSEKVVDGKFNVIEGCKGFLLVVMPAGSEEIDWGTKVKQTGDLTLGEGTLTYTGEGDAFAWVAEAPKEEQVWKTLTFSKDNCKGVSDYTSTWSAKLSAEEEAGFCTFVNFNNNNFANGWDFVAAGNKKGNDLQYATMTTAVVSEELSSISFNILDTATDIMSLLNEVTLFVSDNNGGTFTPVAILDSDFDFGELKITVPEEVRAENLIYKVSFDMSKPSDNGKVVRFDSVSFNHIA